MKLNLLFAIVCLFAASVSNAKLVCTSNEKEGIFSGDFMGTKTLNVSSLDEKKVVLTFGSNGKFEGNFSKKARNGSLVYSCGELTDVADQTDIGNIFVTPSLLQGKSGVVTLSVRQVGDSEGYTWLNESFNCVLKK